MNFDIRKFITSDVGRKLLSILLGLGLSAVFRLSCKEKNCIVYSAPDLNKDITNKVYSYNGNCYVYSPLNVPCDTSKKIMTHHKQEND
jgi:hypothetical protein